jgi:hypothetical protein
MSEGARPRVYSSFSANVVSASARNWQTARGTVSEHCYEPGESRSAGFSEHGRAAIAFATSALVLALKAPDSITRPQFWAEDGTLFFAQAHDELVPRLCAPYRGYFLLLPRLVASVAAPFSASHAPLIYSLGALILGAAALASLRQIRALGVPFPLLLGAVALTPSSVEVFGSLTNSQWLIQFGLLAIAARFWQGDETRHPRLRIVAAALVGLTGVFCVFLTIALAVCWGLVWFARRGSDDHELSLLAARARKPPPEVLVLVACAALQVGCFVGWPGVHDLPSGPIGPALRGVATSVQSHLFCSAILPSGLFLALLAGLVVLAARGLLDRPTGLVILVMILIYVGLQLGATTLKFRGYPDLLESFDNGDRYFVAVKAAIWWVVAIAVASVVPRAPRAAASLVTMALLCASAWATRHLQRPPLPDLEWPRYAKSIDTGLDVTAPINPPPWTVHVPSNTAADDQTVAMQAGLDALYGRHDPAAAAAEFRQVLVRNPTHYGATFQLASALDAAGKHAEARPLWEKMLVMAVAASDTETADKARARLARDADLGLAPGTAGGE